MTDCITFLGSFLIPWLSPSCRLVLMAGSRTAGLTMAPRFRQGLQLNLYTLDWDSLSIGLVCQEGESLGGPESTCRTWLLR